MTRLIKNARWAVGTRYALHGSQRYRPFFIVGSPRSGTTLLRRILQSRPEVHIPPETFVLGKVVDGWKNYQNLDWSDMVNWVLGTFELHEHFDQFEMSLRETVRELRKLKGEERNLARIVHEIIMAHAKSHHVACTRWGEKTPGHSLWMNQIGDVFPDGQFIHMLRDGADCIASWMKSGFTDDPESAALRWVTHVRAVDDYTRENPSRVFTVRYEDLVTDPEPTVLGVCQFLDLPYSATMLTEVGHVEAMGDAHRLSHLQNVKRPISASGIGKGRAELTLAEREIISKIANEDLMQRGYTSLL